jgi:L-seryl-tRNA(Ser) seleniumtransferase
MAGKLALMQAAYAQNRGIGRAMKIGKEGILGLMAALEGWQQGYYREAQEAEKRRVKHIVDRLTGIAGLRATLEYPAPDPYPIMRTRITVDPQQAGLTAMALTQILAEGDPSVRVRAHHAEEGYFLIDPFNLSDEDAEFICTRILEIMAQPAATKKAVVEQLAGLSMADIWSRSGTWPYFEPKAVTTKNAVMP